MRNRIMNQRERDVFDSAYEQERESGLSIKDARWMAWEEVYRFRNGEFELDEEEKKAVNPD
jgi:hypothetical protein